MSNPAAPDAGSSRIGIDIGGTKIAGVVLNAAGDELAATRTPMPRGDYAATLRAVADLIATLAREVPGTPPVGIGLPGTLDPGTGCVKHCNALWLNGRPFLRDLAEMTGQGARSANDGDCFALSEATDGAAAGANTVLGMVLGTGCGGGVVIGGRLIGAPGGIAGEFGHAPVPHVPGLVRRQERCFCGGQDCLEQYVSGTAISRRYADLTGHALPATGITMLADQGQDPAAQQAFSELENILARSLALYAAILDPDIVVLGGGLSNAARLYRNLPPLIAAYAPFGGPRMRLVPPRWGDASGARGAARL